MYRYLYINHTLIKSFKKMWWSSSLFPQAYHAQIVLYKQTFLKIEKKMSRRMHKSSIIQWIFAIWKYLQIESSQATKHNNIYYLYIIIYNHLFINSFNSWPSPLSLHITPQKILPVFEYKNSWYALFFCWIKIKLF